MNKYLTYFIDTLEDVKLAKTASKGSTETSMDYISGSSLRGAYIYRYINKYGVSDINEGIHKEKLLRGGIKFLNAYPASGETRCIPFPRCYYSTKEEMKSIDKELTITSGFNLPKDKVYENVRMAEFVSLEKDKYQLVKVKKKANLHINKSMRDNKLFRYEAIEKGQTFKGIIKVEKPEYADEIISLLENTVFYLGGSKGSGYGKCRFYSFNGADVNPEFDQIANRTDFNGTLYLIALSDIIYRSKLGEYKTIIEDSCIKEALGLEDVELENSMIETKDITTFNNKWGCNLPQIMGIKAGSVFKYSYTGDLKKDKLKSFIDRGIGERKVDGFGRFVIIDSIKDSVLLVEEQNTKSEADVMQLVSDMSPNEKEQAQIILDSVYRSRFENNVNKRVIDLYEKIGNARSMNVNQWGFYMNLFDYLQYHKPSIGKQIFSEIIRKIKKKRSSSLKQIEKVRIADGSLMDFFCESVESSEDVNRLTKENQVKEIVLDGLTAKIDNEYAYKINIKILTELCRYHIRREKKYRE